MQIYDVIIIGAGPSGAMAGYYLAKSGLDVLLIEKSKFPRLKVCGGGLTWRAFGVLPFDVVPVIHKVVTWGNLAFKGRQISVIHGENPISFLIDRETFDALLLKKAVAQGADCITGERFKSFAEQNNQVDVQTDQHSYHCRTLIGADGVHSLVANQAGLLSNRPTSLSYEARLTLPIGKKPPLIESITFDFGTLLFGYGWVFPKQDHINVGVFRSWPGKRTTKNHLLRFIDQHPALNKTDLIDIRAHPVPLGGKYTTLHKNQILLIGDAANLADPWLGEGIYYALASGRMAAESICRHLAGTCDDLSEYTQRVNDSLITQLSYARKLSLLINIFPLINVLSLKSSIKLQQMIISLLRGDLTHQQIWQDLKKHFPKYILDILCRI